MIRAVAFLLALTFSSTGAVAAVSTPFSIHPGDRLAITVNGEPSLSQQVLVGSDGAIVLPLAGVVPVAGGSASDAATAIASALGRYLRTPMVAVALVQEGQVDVTVLGDVINPGTYKLRPGASVSEALAAAGGLDPTHLTPTKARIVTAEQSVREVPLSAVLQDDGSLGVALSEHSLVYVQGAQQFDVTVLGAVRTPGAIAINEGDRLSMAIAKAGSNRGAHSDLSRIVVTRTEPDGTTAAHEVDLYRAIDGNDRRYDPLLRKGDIIYVPMAGNARGIGAAAIFLAQKVLGIP